MHIYILYIERSRANSHTTVAWKVTLKQINQRKNDLFTKWRRKNIFRDGLDWCAIRAFLFSIWIHKNTLTFFCFWLWSKSIMGYPQYGQEEKSLQRKKEEKTMIKLIPIRGVKTLPQCFLVSRSVNAGAARGRPGVSDLTSRFQVTDWKYSQFKTDVEQRKYCFTLNRITLRPKNLWEQKTTDPTHEAKVNRIITKRTSENPQNVICLVKDSLNSEKRREICWNRSARQSVLNLNVLEMLFVDNVGM